MPDSQDDQPQEKKEVLDLLSGGAKKPSRRERQRQEASKTKTLADHKKEALDIFEEEGKKKTSSIRKKVDVEGGRKTLPSISKFQEESAVPEKEIKQSSSEPVELEVSSVEVSDDKVITLKPPVIVNELANMMGLKVFEIMKDLVALQVFVAPNQAIEPEIAAKVCEAHGFAFEREKREKGGGVHKVEEKIEAPELKKDKPVEEQMDFRAPIITFMGHVDHGKTSLMDYIRGEKVAADEAGGITQHIGAYRVENDGSPITFIDTPGHAIFTAMRARGADVTDIIVLIVAADDGVMPQTKEAIAHAKAADKTLIVAINKCDLPGADPLRVRTQLMEHGVNPVDLGGDVECVEVSAATGDGVQDLIDLMALQAEVLELKANPKANARACVIEASVQPGKGPVASMIVVNGTLKVGKPFICGPYAGKVKSMTNEKGEEVKEVGPSTPVEIGGFAELPNVGDELIQMKSERDAKKLSAERLDELRVERLELPKKSRMEDILAMVAKTEKKAELKVILKTDVQGSVQAIQTAISEVESAKVDCRFIHAAAGSITESDIILASSADSVILGFNTKVESKAVAVAKREGVQIKLFSVVYELIDQVKDAMLGLLDPVLRETVIGHAEVKKVYKVNRGKAAGSYVSDGKILRSAHARVLRGGLPVFDGKMSTLRRFNDEVKEIKQGLECGIRLGEFNEYEEGDIIECYLLDKIQQTL